MTTRFFPLIAASIGLLLSGCFMSEQPSFPMTTAVAAFGDGGRYQAYERQDDGSYKKDEVIELKHRDDGGYDFVNQKGEVQPISLHQIAGSVLVGQAKSQERPGYAYVMFRMSGNEALIFVPQCDKQDKAMLDRFGVTVSGRHECSIDRVTDATEFFASLSLGDPTSKLVRE